MTNVLQNPEPFITHHSVDDHPLMTFEDAIAIFQKHFTVTDPLLFNHKLIYNKFSGLAFAKAYMKTAQSIITQYNLPLEVVAWEKYKSSVAIATFLTVTYKP